VLWRPPVSPKTRKSPPPASPFEIDVAAADEENSGGQLRLGD
jgi:hypothetical protein